MDDQVPDEVKKERIQRLVDLVQQHAARRNAALVGSVQEVLVEGPSRTDPAVLRGRTRDEQGGQLRAATRAAGRRWWMCVIDASTCQTLAGRRRAAAAA